MVFSSALVGQHIQRTSLSMVMVKKVRIGFTHLWCFESLILFQNLTLCNPMDCSLPGSSIHGILQARILEWVAMPSSRGSSWPRDWTRLCLLHWQVGSLPLAPTGMPHNLYTELVWPTGLLHTMDWMFRLTSPTFIRWSLNPNVIVFGAGVFGSYFGHDNLVVS